MTRTASISAIVPARNEEAVLAACIVTLAQQPEIGEILAINDQSSDGTAEVLQGLAERIPQLRILETHGVPAGWVGKNYAVWLGAAQARLPWLLFTDADAEHLEGSAARALQLSEENQAALVSFSPEQITDSWWEKALIPFVYSRLAERFSYDEVNNPDSAAAAANGQYLLIHRDAYDAVGGHAAVASKILEDVALARHAKAAGYRLWFGPGIGAVRVRMYRTFGAMWEGWKKNLYVLMGSSPAAMRSELLSSVPCISLLLLLAAVVWPLLGFLGLALLLGRHATYAAALSRNQVPLSRIIYYVPAFVLYAAVLIASWRSHARGRVEWKGREYPVEAPATGGRGH